MTALDAFNLSLTSIRDQLDTPGRTFISLDCEMTGLQLQKHGICQIGAYATGESEDDFKGYFQSDCNPHYSSTNGECKPVAIDQSALDVNDFTRERIDAAPHLVVVEHDLYRWLTKWPSPVIVGSAIGGDIAWLRRDFARIGLNCDVFRRAIDTISLGFALFDSVEGQGKLCDRLGIKNHGAHDALADAIVNSKLFHRLRDELIGGRPVCR